MYSVVFGPFLISLLVAAISIPVIIRVADLKHLTDAPDGERKFHKGKIPTLGGIGIFGGCLFSFSAFTDYLGLMDIKFMTPALVLLFFAGVKDDILILSPVKKLLVQILCATLIVIVGELRLSSLWGIFGVNEIPWAVGNALTIVAIVGLINAFNFIDGVNGLAASLGIVASAFFGTWFFLVDSFFLSVLSFSLMGSLCGFLYYNLNPARIFMGDTGSMIIGFIVSILAIKFVELNRSGLIPPQYYIKAAPGVAIAVLSVPMFDLIRVFILRLLQRKSPFAPDRSHIHHLFLSIGCCHNLTTVLLVLFTLASIAVSFLMRDYRSFEVVLVLLAMYGVGVGAVTLLKKWKGEIVCQGKKRLI